MKVTCISERGHDFRTAYLETRRRDQKSHLVGKSLARSSPCSALVMKYGSGMVGMTVTDGKQSSQPMQRVSLHPVHDGESGEQS
jgi:hypothetical protein